MIANIAFRSHGVAHQMDDRPLLKTHQITSTHQLVPNMKIRVHNHQKPVFDAVVTARPIKDHRVLCVPIQWIDKNGMTMTGDLVLSSYSVIRHDDGSWDTKNWLEEVLK